MIHIIVFLCSSVDTSTRTIITTAQPPSKAVFELVAGYLLAPSDWRRIRRELAAADKGSPPPLFADYCRIAHAACNRLRKCHGGLEGEGASVAAAALGDAASLLQLCTAGSGARAIRRGGYHAKERRSPKKADAGEQC